MGARCAGLNAGGACSFSSNNAAISAKRGAPATISLVIPVKLSIYGGMRHSGLMSELHSSTTSPLSIRTMPTSVMR